jgi:outer membrane protein TolC
MTSVSGVTADTLGQKALRVDTEQAADAARVRVRRLLASPLSAESAAQIALFNNKGLQAAYNELGIAETLRVEASLPPNPTFSLSRVSTSVELDVERQLVGDVLALATLPARSEIAADRFRQFDAARETLGIGLLARRAWYRAVASQQLAAFLEQANQAAATSAKLATELGRTGALNKLDQAREQSFQLELSAELATARRHALSDREALVRVMGLTGGDLSFTLPGSLPALPRQPWNLPAIETEAVRQRVDVHIARIAVEALAKSYGLTSATRFINLLDVAGVSRTQRETGVAHGTGGGVEVDFQVPIFDFGEVRLRQAREAYMQAVNRLIEKVVNAQSEARDAYQAYHSTYDIAASYRDRILPLRQVIADETTLHYGAMQIDVFALLTEARQRVTVNIAAIEAQLDFWLASADLTAAVAGGGTTDGPGAMTRIAVSPAAPPGE